MARDPIQGAAASPDPSDDAFAALGTAIERRLHGGGVELELRDALRALVRQARAQGLLVEDVLVRLKELLQSLPNVRQLRDPQERVQLTERIVTMCIEEYYS